METVTQVALYFFAFVGVLATALFVKTMVVGAREEDVLASWPAPKPVRSERTVN